MATIRGQQLFEEIQYVICTRFVEMIGTHCSCVLHVHCMCTYLQLHLYSTCMHVTAVVCRGIVLAWTQNHGTGFAQTDH